MITSFKFNNNTVQLFTGLLIFEIYYDKTNMNVVRSKLRARFKKMFFYGNTVVSSVCEADNYLNVVRLIISYPNIVST
jgi:hypothetical protein